MVFEASLRSNTVTWGSVQKSVKGLLPETCPQRHQLAHMTVPTLLIAMFGQQEFGWYAEKDERGCTIKIGRRKRPSR